MMIKKNTYDIDIMSMVLEYRFKNKIITNLHTILLELSISDNQIYKKLITKNVEEIINEIINKITDNYDYEIIKNIILNYLEKGGT